MLDHSSACDLSITTLQCKLSIWYSRAVTCTFTTQIWTQQYNNICQKFLKFHPNHNRSWIATIFSPFFTCIQTSVHTSVLWCCCLSDTNRKCNIKSHRKHNSQTNKKFNQSVICCTHMHLLDYRYGELTHSTTAILIISSSSLFSSHFANLTGQTLVVILYTENY